MAKPNINPPGCATSRLRPATHMHALLLLPYADATCRLSPEPSCVDKTNKDWLPWQRPLMRDRETSFRSIIYSHSSANPENLAKIGQVDFEIIGLTEIVTNKKQQQNI